MVFCAIVLWEVFWLSFDPLCRMFDGGKEPHFDLGLVMKLVVMFVLSEIHFTCVHVLMHTRLPKLHLLHHLSVATSFSSTYIFHPIDFLLEISPPLIVGVLIGLICCNDVFAYLVHMTITVTWYAMDHDAFLKTAHAKHHRNVNEFYHAYNPSSGKNLVATDQVLKLMSSKSSKAQ
eukprot:TRINITY_DN57661_c0_g1_i1.p1 TRINITY_DN57661_c0_g1~~TRINITY_DN57661_c0_g1_i1.p1  ORF type:complete len:176 (+),score=30.87 TRINITY_DN57661_c0_g1_i1:453-980(+)